MPVVEENVSSATWLPRMADFEGYAPLFKEGVLNLASPSCESPMEDFIDAANYSILADRIHGTTVPEASSATPVVLRKPPNDGTRKSARKSKSLARPETGGESPVTDPPYKPRRSKYDVH